MLDLTDKNGKPLKGAALQKRLAKICRNNPVTTTSIKNEIIKPKVWDEAKFNESIERIEQMLNILDNNEPRTSQAQEKLQILENFNSPSRNTNILTILSNDLINSMNKVEDLTNLVVDQDLRIHRLEQQLNNNSTLTCTAKSIIETLLVGSITASILGIFIMLLASNQVKLGSAFGFVGGASISLLKKLKANH